MDSRTLIETLTRQPETDERAFTERQSHAAIHRMAGQLAVEMAAAAGGQPVCLCARDRAVVAAALLAGLDTGIPLILPHATSAATLAGLRAEMAYETAIVDGSGPDPLPDGVKALVVEATFSAGTSAELHPKLTLDSPWVYLFTGGSTGTPKIWTKTPVNLLAETAYLVERFRVTPEDRILATAPPNHIYGLLYGVLMPLLGGARVSAATPGFPHEIINAVTTGRATILVSLPVHYRSLKSHTFGDHRLRLAFSSAGPLDPSDGEAFSTATGAPIYEIYGSTETGGIASRCRHKGETDLTPFDPVTVAVEGERALVSGPFISPDLPRDRTGRFQLADRLVRTPEGRLRLQGRSDGIVKVGGKRVDLEVVREALKRQAGVNDAVVFGLAGEGGRAVEIAAVIEGGIDAAALRKALQTELEPQALPRRIEVVDRMPMLATGKYDRQGLRRLFE